jgi:hypothetical protein
MAEQIRWELVIDDKGAPKLVAVSDGFEKLGKKSEDAGKRMRKMSDDSEKANAAVKVLGDRVDAASVAMGNWISQGLQAVGSEFVDQIKIAWEYAGTIDDMSQRLNVSTTDLQYMSEWAEQSGTSVEVAAKAMAKLSVKIADGDSTLKRYNITSGDSVEAFVQVADAVENAATQQEKAKIANAAFGKQWVELMPILKQGKEGLEELAGAVDVISQQDIEAVAKLDDALLRMKSSARGLAVEFLAAFGPEIQQQIEDTAAAIKMARDWMKEESEGDFLKRVGVTQYGFGGNNLVSQQGKFEPHKMSSDDLQRLIGIRNEARKNNGYENLERGATNTLEGYYKAALIREKEERAKAEAAEAKRRADEAKAQAELDAENARIERERNQRLKDAQAEADAIEYRRNTVNVDFFGGNDTAMRDYQTYDWNRPRDRSFARSKDVERVANMSAADAALRKKSIGELDEFGWRDGNKISYATSGGMAEIDTVSASSEELAAASAAAQNFQREIGAIIEAEEQATEKTAEFRAAWERVSESIADTASSELAPAIYDVFVEGEDAMDKFGDAAGNILRSLVIEFTQLTIKWAILKGLAAASSGTGPGTLLSFIGGGHATGTVSSPGGILSLGEQGPEAFRTPSGQAGIAAGGVYSVPKGTQVWRNEPSQITISPVFHASGANAEDLARAVMPRLQTLVYDAIDSRGRTRGS